MDLMGNCSYRLLCSLISGPGLTSFLFWYQKFLCGGRAVFGPDASSLFLTTFLIGGPAIAFCIKMLLLIIRNDDPQYDYPVLVGGMVLAIMVGKLKFLGNDRPRAANNFLVWPDKISRRTSYFSSWRQVEIQE